MDDLTLLAEVKNYLAAVRGRPRTTLQTSEVLFAKRNKGAQVRQNEKRCMDVLLFVLLVFGRQ